MAACIEIEEELSAYLDGEVSAETRAAVEEHLRSCAACRAVLEDLKSIRNVLSDLPKVSAPATLAASLHREIAASPAGAGAPDSAALKAASAKIDKSIDWGAASPPKQSAWAPVAFGLAAMLVLCLLTFVVVPAIMTHRPQEALSKSEMPEAVTVAADESGARKAPGTLDDNAAKDGVAARNEIAADNPATTRSYNYKGDAPAVSAAPAAAEISEAAKSGLAAPHSGKLEKAAPQFKARESEATVGAITNGLAAKGAGDKSVDVANRAEQDRAAKHLAEEVLALKQQLDEKTATAQGQRTLQESKKKEAAFSRDAGGNRQQIAQQAPPKPQANANPAPKVVAPVIATPPAAAAPAPGAPAASTAAPAPAPVVADGIPQMRGKAEPAKTAPQAGEVASQKVARKLVYDKDMKREVAPLAEGQENVVERRRALSTESAAKEKKSAGEGGFGGGAGPAGNVLVYQTRDPEALIKQIQELAEAGGARIEFGQNAVLKDAEKQDAKPADGIIAGNQLGAVSVREFAVLTPGNQHEKILQSLRALQAQTPSRAAAAATRYREADAALESKKSAATPAEAPANKPAAPIDADGRREGLERLNAVAGAPILIRIEILPPENPKAGKVPAK